MPRCAMSAGVIAATARAARTNRASVFIQFSSWPCGVISRAARLISASSDGKRGEGCCFLAALAPRRAVSEIAALAIAHFQNVEAPLQRKFSSAAGKIRVLLFRRDRSFAVLG